jgi:hypothetical protein
MIADARQAAVARQAPKVDHIATLQKFVYRLPAVENEPDRKRLESVIQTYTTLYAHG